MSIKLSPKYGVNPSIPVCFFCGQEKQEIVMFGRIGDGRKGEDIEAPRSAIIDYEPCDCCKTNMEKGITLIGVTTKQPADDRPMISKNHGVYPTGKWCVVTEDCINRLVNDPNMANDIITNRKTFIDDTIIETIIKESEQFENSNNSDEK